MPIVRSKLKDVEIPEVTLQDEIYQKLLVFPEKCAIVDAASGRSYTYRQVYELSRRVASGLVRIGIKKGDIIALQLPNLPEYALIVLGALSAGATITTINPTYTTYEVEHQLKDVQAVAIVTAQTLDEVAKAAASKVPSVKHIIGLGDVPGAIPFLQLVTDDGSLFPSQMKFNLREDIAFIPYSSGTTGLPKGVMLTHHNIVANFYQTSSPELKMEGVLLDTTATHQEVTLGLLPFFHSYGLFVILLGGLRVNIKIVTITRFAPDVFLHAIQDHKISMMGLVPPIVLFVAKSPMAKKFDLSSVKVCGCGAAPLSKDTEEEFRARVPKAQLVQGYGMTETAPAITAPGRDAGPPGSCGIVVPNTEIQIVDLDSGRSLGVDQRGEIWVRGPQVMKGYFNKPEQTANTIDKDGWLHTGDVGYYDKDGRFYIVDRIKELIKYKAFQVAPAEMEALLLTHPSVSDAGVIGIPDEEAGELPRAFVVRKPGSNLTEKDIHTYVNERAAPYKRFRGGVYFIEEIPKSMSGKILRNQLRDMKMKTKSKL